MNKMKGDKFMGKETKDTSVDVAKFIGNQFKRPSNNLINKSQPLDVIGGGIISIKKFDESRIIRMSGSLTHTPNTGSTGYENICDVCQIPRFTGSCINCGIYQYCLGNFDNDTQFEIVGVRRINNGTGTKSSDVESDS